MGLLDKLRGEFIDIIEWTEPNQSDILCYRFPRYNNEIKMNAKLTVREGQNAVFVNEGQNVHEVEIKDLIPETKIQPGETKQFTVTPKQQSYKLYCEIHEDSGMVGEFVGQ